MLELKNVKKDYQISTNVVHALRGVSLSFRENEFVAILGPSGCGKTTMLNLIGGLDRYTSGDIIIGGVSTANFDEQHWDAYRNATIGFVFQSYNLIPHLTVVENVELALCLIGEKKKIRREKAINALRSVGMETEINKRPNQLSGGQMQRVAIARALVNDPKIILADEPTGALDSELSVQVMDILKEVSKTKLVIMVTHNAELANEYCTRICKFKDGNLINDSNPYILNENDVLGIDANNNINDTSNIQNNTLNIGFGNNDEINTGVEPLKKRSNRQRKKEMKNISGDTKEFFEKIGVNRLSRKEKKEKIKQGSVFKKTQMSFGTAFGISMRNLFSKKKRTFFTSLAGAIGIVGLGLVLSISNGFNVYVDNMQTELLADVPLGMYEYNVDSNAILNMMTNLTETSYAGEAYPEGDALGIDDTQTNTMELVQIMIDAFFDGNASKNDMSGDFAEYIKNMPSDYYKALVVNYGTRFNLISQYKDDSGNIVYKDSSQMPPVTSVVSIATTVLGQNGEQSKYWNEMVGGVEAMSQEYDLLEGSWPSNSNELVICVDKGNNINSELVRFFSYDSLYETDANGNPIIDYVDSNGENVYKIKSDAKLSDLIGKELKLIDNDNYYQKDSNGDYYVDNVDWYEVATATLLGSGEDCHQEWNYTDQAVLSSLYNSSSSTTLKITGVIRVKEDSIASYVGSAICYLPELGETVADKAYNSEVANLQRQLDSEAEANGTNYQTFFGSTVNKDVDLLSHHEFVDIVTGATHEYSSYSRAIGTVKEPVFVSVYANSYSDKELAANYISEYKSASGESVGYFDVSDMFVANVKAIIDLVSYILIAVASISLVVSTVMIGVITSNSVIERIHEIGILRAIGARGQDVSMVFLSETSLVGLVSGLMGIVLTYIFAPLINLVISAVAGVDNLLVFNPLHALILVALSFVLTIISGIIPAINASKKNIVDALRVE